MRACVSALASPIGRYRVPAALKLLLQLREPKCPEHDKGWTSRDRMFDPQPRWKGAAVLAERSDRALCKDPGEAKYRKPQLGLFHSQLRQRPRYVERPDDRLSDTCATSFRKSHGYQRWYAGWPGFTATKVPRAVAQTLPPARSSASTIARSPATSTGRATSSIGPFVGVGRSSFTAYSAVTVHGGVSAFARRLRWYAAA